ncbi:MAG: site-specific DNA-methyltransferase [Actinobacteria bacterium]|nr:site-specific DNA-methyltransferase [Actinomycetota bacterium]MBO0785565.1 site-specific DNA-methyltransferase [Actinomycetota bacterium]MBO0817757.1 site-specific DNA-methyltransferase [Actinomycetota bacterium]
MGTQPRLSAPPAPRLTGAAALGRLVSEGVTWGDSAQWLPVLPEASVDLWFTSPPYADARAYSRIHPDRYVEWFLPFGASMLAATSDTGWLVLNIKNRVARDGPLRGQRHPYVYQLVLALQQQGWRWLETYIWSKPNAVPGRFGPRTKDSFEYVYAFARGSRPYFDLDAVRVPYKTTLDEIGRRQLDRLGRRNTGAGFGRDRTKTYLRGGADPGNVVSVPQTYNQHRGAGGHTAAMPEGLAEFFVRACSPAGGVVLDPFAGSGTTAVAARRHGRRAGGLEIHQAFVAAARQRLSLGAPDNVPVLIETASG